MAEVQVAYGHPVIPADTPGLPAVDSGVVEAADLPAELLEVLAAAVAQNIALNEAPQTAGGPADILSLNVYTDYSCPVDENYVAANVSANDTDGTGWGYTFTVI